MKTGTTHERPNMSYPPIHLSSGGHSLCWNQGGLSLSSRPSHTSTGKRRPERLRSGGEDTGAGRSPHHSRWIDQAERDRLLAGRAGHAVRVRAAQSGQAGRESPLLRSRRRPADHGLHQRIARGRRTATRRERSAASSTSRSTCRGRRSMQAPGAAARTRHRVHPARSRLHGLHLPPRPQRPQGRALLLQVRTARRAYARSKS